jgi:hypothetical protein
MFFVQSKGNEKEVRDMRMEWHSHSIHAMHALRNATTIMSHVLWQDLRLDKINLCSRLFRSQSIQGLCHKLDAQRLVQTGGCAVSIWIIRHVFRIL